MPIMREGALWKERFEAKIQPEPTSGCWLWTGALSQGYGIFNIGGGYGTTRAHRITWELAHGTIPSGLCLDHKCRVRSCCNPDHLHVVTPLENFLAPGSLSPMKLGPKQTHCIHSHEFTPKNTYRRRGIGGGQRICKACVRIRVAKYRAEHKGCRKGEKARLRARRREKCRVGIPSR